MNDEESRCFTSSLTNQYFAKLRNAYRLFLESPQYKLVLHGSEFDELCGLVLWKSGESDSFYVEMECSYDARAYIIHRSITVCEIEHDIKKQFLENRNDCLTLYLVKSKKRGLFYIALDEKGQDAFRSGDCGLPVTDIEMISENVQKPILSGQKFLEQWRKRSDNHLILMYELASFTSGAQESELKPAALKSIPGFILDVWPSEVSSWIDRKRSWPSPSVVEEAKKQNLFCVPLSSVLLDNNSPPDDEMFSLLWLVDFSEAEAVLVRNITEFQKHVLLMFVKAYWKENPCGHRLLYRSLQLRHGFFWTLETSSKELWGNSDASTCVREICKTVSSFLDEGFFPHYFMPEFDLLTFDRCWKFTCLSSCPNQVPIFRALFERFSSMSLVSESNFDAATENQIACILREKLEILSKQSMTLLFTLVYQRLHSASLDNAIDQHLELLLFLDHRQTDCSDTRDLKNSFKAWITASLGVKYLIKLQQSPCDSLKTELELKARECFASCSQHSVLHTAYSKLFLLSNWHTTSAASNKDEISVSDSLYKNTGEYANEYENSEHNQTADEASRLSASEFSQSLSRRMISACNEIDFMFTQMERPLLSSIPGLLSTLEFARCYVLGCSRSPVYSLSSEFLCNVFQILLLKNDGKITEALKVLTQLENEVLAQSKSAFMNDRKVVACLFIIASIFYRLNRKEESLRSLKSARNAFRSPRNPASWKIVQTYTDKLKRCMTFGVEVLFVSGIVAVCAVYFSRMLA